MRVIYANLRAMKKYKSVLYELVCRDIKVRYKGSFLGLLWTIFNPILTMLVMTLVFSKLFRFEIENFTVYFLTANILFTLMTESTTNALNSIVDNSSLLKKVYLPKYLLPLSKVLSSVINLVFSFLAMILVMIITKTPFHAAILLSPIAMFYTIIFSAGIGLILSTVMVFFKDIAQLYGVFTMLWMYLTPIFYPISLLEENAPIALILNPMYHFISYFRSLILEGAVPGIKENIICLAVSVIVFCIGLVFFYKKQDHFILHI